MSPALHPGHVVIFLRRPPRTGDVVIAVVNGREIVKRVARITQNGLQLLGDNSAASTDSRQFGLVPHAAVKGKLVWPRIAGLT